MTSRRLSRRSWQFLILVLCWVVAAAVLAFGVHQLQYVMSNIDGISYIRIAEHYFAGRFDDGVNAYWSPMISWSMLPFMAAGVASQAAFVAASAAWSAIGIVAGTWFVWRRTDGNLFAALSVGAALGALYVGNLMNLTPDLVVVTWTILFAWTVTEVDERLLEGTLRSRILWGVLLGAVLALGYFVKAFLVPVFVVVGLGWLVTRLVVLLRATDRGVRLGATRHFLVTPVAAVLALALLMAPFVTALTVKYGGFTTGSSFAVNFQGKFGDGDDVETAVTLELPAPPNDHAISFGEDRTAQLSLGSSAQSGPESSIVDKAAYYLEQRLKALPKYTNRIAAISPFGVTILVVFFLLIAFRRLDPRSHRAATITAVTGAVYFLGYAAIIGGNGGGGNLRYYWPLLALPAIVAALLWPTVWRRARALGSWWRPALVLGLALLVPVAGVGQHFFGTATPFSTGRSFGGRGYLSESPEKPSGQVFAEKLRADGVIEEGSRLAAGSGYAIRTLLYAFYMRVQIFGRDQPHDITDPRFQQVLRDNRIDYYFLYEPTEQEPMDVSAWGTVKESFEMSFSCGPYLVDGVEKESSGCRLSIVAVRP